SGDTRLSAFARGYNDDSDISAATTVRSWRDTGAKLEYRPDGDTSLSATLSQRDIDTERLNISGFAIAPFIVKFKPGPTREELAGLREESNASGKLLDVVARHRFNDRFYISASLHEQSFDKLPEVTELLENELAPSYFANRRRQASLHAAYDLRDLGNVTFRADTDHRSNSTRESSLKREQYTLGYSAPLCRTARLGLGVTRQTTVIETSSADDDFDGSGWNYSLNLAGTSHCTDYVLSANRSSSAGHDGDLSSLGLE
ncbi:MAG: hypothetical protein M3R04_08655, partial [bacterium]|nr:hypothetical protein [bacterium]